MIEPELMAKITGTPGSEMFYVTTLEEATRWAISVVGLNENLPGAMKPQYACENALAYPVALPSELNGNSSLIGDAVFSFSPLNSNSGAKFASAPKAVVGQVSEITSIRAGYVAVGCSVAVGSDFVQVCGYDEATDTYVGACGAKYGMQNYSRITLLHPKTEIRTLGLPNGVAADVRRVAYCEIKNSSGKITDSEWCLHSVIFSAAGKQPLTRHVFDWPSDAKNSRRRRCRASWRDQRLSTY